MPRRIKRFHLFGDEMFVLDEQDHLAAWNNRAAGWDLSFTRVVQQIDYMPTGRATGTVVVLDVDGNVWVRSRVLGTDDEKPEWELLEDLPERHGVEVDLGTQVV